MLGKLSAKEAGNGEHGDEREREIKGERGRDREKGRGGGRNRETRECLHSHWPFQGPAQTELSAYQAE